MYEAQLVKQCAPTLAGMKTGTLFGCAFPDASALKECMRRWNRSLTPKGVRAIPARYQNGRAMIYLYRPARLSADLRDGRARQLLQARGYCPDCSECCVARLMRRLSAYESFPHEVGLFLGYPPEDVSGFIEHRACGFKCVGCWKVYGDAEAAQKTFEKYKKCTDVYCNQFANGRSLERLTVADGSHIL